LTLETATVIVKISIPLMKINQLQKKIELLAGRGNIQSQTEYKMLYNNLL